jgi:acyl-CoA dehydrogenase
MEVDLRSPRVLERGLGITLPHPDGLSSLEQGLEAFTEALADAPVDESDEHGATRTYVERLARSGFTKLVVPSAYGGAHEVVRSIPLCITRQWLARQSGALDTAFIMQGLGSYPVTMAGPEPLRQAFLPKVAAGEAICAFALTEPEAGSDVAAMRTVAEPSTGGVVLRGHKAFISNAGVATSYVVFARESVAGDKPRFGAFWVPADAEGLRVDPIRVIAPHPIGSVHLDGVFVPTDHRLGDIGEGLSIALGTLDVFRVSVGAAALGLADRALDETIAHLSRRVQFGKPLAKQQGLRFAVAEVATEHMAAQLLVYRAAAARDAGHPSSDQVAMAKLHATETAQRVIDRAVQSLGGLGVTVGSVPERLYREIRALRIYEGTSEIQKLVIARALFHG